MQTGLHLLDFKNTRQSNSLNTVTIRWSDADSTNTSYNIILSDSTGVLAQDGGVVKQAIYNNLRSNHTYRHKIFSVPRNDSLTIRFNIGTMGDVDIKTE